MAQVIDSVPFDCTQACCCYVNASSKIQVVRITNISNWYFERVVFPGQRLMFEAPADALLEVHCGMMASSILSDTIPCNRLQLQSNDIAQFSSARRDLEQQSDGMFSQSLGGSVVHDLLAVSPSVAS